MAAPHFASISEVSALFRAKQLSPVELLDAHLSRIAALQPKLNVYVHLDADAARSAALAATEKLSRNEPVGPLHGIPVSVKSCLDVAGWPNAAGSLLRANEIPSRTAPVVERLRAAGAIVVGTTNTPEFLMNYETNNRLSGPTSNPWSLAHSSGGSSGGEAAAIAAGCSFGGIGSDGGGSIRVPAHFCGICGLKPTPGRIPSTGHFPPGNNSYGWIGVVGPMARTVADLRLLFSVLAGPDPGDALTVPAPLQEISTDAAQKIRVGLINSSAVGHATPETLSAVDRATKLLENSGFRIEPVTFHSLDRVLDLWWFFFGTFISQLFAQATAGKESQLSPNFLEYMQFARPENPTTLLDFIAKSTARDLERARILKTMEDFPVLLSPACSGPAFRHGKGSWKSPDGYRETMRHSQWLNLAGLPGLTVPIATSTDGLPIGVQLIGRPFSEELLLTVGESLELARGPWQPPPGTPIS